MENAAGFTPEENVTYDWMEIITMENWIITCVEKLRYRRIVKHDFKIAGSGGELLLLQLLQGQLLLC